MCIKLMTISNHYRPEIDGMRALAVLIILLFHAGFDWASGGYIGVDVFFVISGYLITQYIVRDIENKQFSFSLFYIRRIKRLFPALFATLLLTFVCAFFVFSPSDLERLGGSIQYAALSISNFFFWQESGYFNEGSEIKPLLHMWSLAVEEQFYFIWPAIIVFVLLLFTRLALVLFLIVASIISLCLNSYYLTDHASTVFFHLPFRIFEFSIGALCFFYPISKWHNTILKNIMTITGMFLIGFPVLFFDHNTTFPGFNALMPCIGTALIIVSGQSFIARHFLSHKFMVKIGLISYSVYLIHWPLMVFYKYLIFIEINLIEQIGLIVASLLLGFLMWKFIERPFRYTKNPDSKVKFWLKFIILIGSVLGIGYFSQINKGWPNRYPQEFFMSSQERNQNRDRYWEEFTDIIKNKKTENKNVIVMGNSHAVDLVYAFIENGAKLNYTFFNTWFKCFNFGTAIQKQDRKQCDQKRIKYFKDPAWKSTQAIYLHDNWAVLDISDLKARLQEIRTLSKAPITVFGPKMTYTKPVPSIVLSHMRMASLNQYSQKFSEFDYLNKVNIYAKKLIEESNIPNLSYVDVLTVQCGMNKDNCEIISEENNEFLYFDKDHFTVQGAKEFGHKLKIKHPNLFE